LLVHFDNYCNTMENQTLIDYINKNINLEISRNELEKSKWLVEGRTDLTGNNCNCNNATNEVMNIMIQKPINNKIYRLKNQIKVDECPKMETLLVDVNNQGAYVRVINATGGNVVTKVRIEVTDRMTTFFICN